MKNTENKIEISYMTIYEVDYYLFMEIYKDRDYIEFMMNKNEVKELRDYLNKVLDK